jgi:uncharacterized protein YkwD
MIGLALAAVLLIGAPADTATLQAINGARAERGVPPVRADARLAQAARGHSREMVARSYFDHVSPAGSDLRSRVAGTGWLRGRPDWALGEDIAWGTGVLASPAEVVAAWLRSPPHRRILLGRGFRRVGIGIADGTPSAGPGATYTADFGS